MGDVSQTTNSNVSYEMKILYFYSNFTDVPECPIGNDTSALVYVLVNKLNNRSSSPEPMMATSLRIYVPRPQCVNIFRQRQNGRHFADDNLKCIS